MTLDNMTGITKGSYTGFCKSQLITCHFVKSCNGVCPFEDALKHADKTQTMNKQHTVDHDRNWVIGCIQHDGFIKTDRFDKANQIILDALQTEVVRCKDCRHRDLFSCPLADNNFQKDEDFCSWGERREE
jgi:ferredoxin